jgi:hypothetical protein
VLLQADLAVVAVVTLPVEGRRGDDAVDLDSAVDQSALRGPDILVEDQRLGVMEPGAGDEVGFSKVAWVSVPGARSNVRPWPACW